MTVTDVSSRIINALYLSDPDLDTSIGTPLRKIIDAVSVQIDQGTSDSYLLNYQYDIDSKTGGELDDFVANFGLARLQGQRAVGTITFSRSTAIAATKEVTIAPGIQVVALTSPPIYAQTLVGSSMAIGQSSVDVPIQAVVAGPEGNLLANTLTTLVNAIDGVSTCNNALPLTGGTSSETDDQLKYKFKTTAFRNLAGTDAMFRGVALQTLADSTDPTSTSVTRVNTLGATLHNSEQLNVVGGSAASPLNSSAYNVASSVYVASASTGNALSVGSQYTVTVNNAVKPATLSIVAVGNNMPDGFYNVEYDYVPIASRNDPFGTRWSQGVVNNRVDVYVNGVRSGQATQSLHYVNTVKFNNTAGDSLLNTRFISPNGANPAVNDVFIPLGFGPVLSVPGMNITPAGTMTINGTTYTYGLDYEIVHQDDAFGYSPSSQFGIYFKMASAKNISNPIPNNTNWTMSYTYNVVPRLVTDNIANWRLMGTDLRVHAGKIAYLTLNFIIVYAPNSTATAVNTDVTNALSDYLGNLGFSAAVQVSDLVQVAHNVAGVDNIRLTSAVDAAAGTPTLYGIQLVQPNGTVISNYNAGGRPTDVYFDERTYPVLYSINFVPKARNTFLT